MKGSRLPVLFDDRSNSLRILLVVVVPAVFGAIAGLALGASVAFYWVLQAIAALGGLVAGLEHRKSGQAAIRGLFGGLFFGAGIAITHELVGGTDHGLLPQPALLPVITAVAGGILASLGALVRRRVEA
jgi:hypothetical protein